MRGLGNTGIKLKSWVIPKPSTLSSQALLQVTSKTLMAKVLKHWHLLLKQPTVPTRSGPCSQPWSLPSPSPDICQAALRAEVHLVANLVSCFSPAGIKKSFMWQILWEGLGAGGEGDDRGWDGWMASPTRWTWVWVNSGSLWWTGRPGVLRFMGSQRVGHDWVTELTDTFMC